MTRMTPKDATATRERILDQAADLFNQRGYWGTSLSDLLAATGLEKGGLYHHFDSKEALALEAFEHGVDRIRAAIREALAGVHEAVPRLHTVIDTYASFVERPPVAGGCPLLNTAVEADDTHPALRARAASAMTELLDGTFGRILTRGIERGELRADLDVEGTAALFVAAIEGGVMLSKLYGDNDYMRRTARRLHDLVDGLPAAHSPRGSAR